MKLSMTEMKILVYRKMKDKLMTYSEAYNEVSRDIEHLKNLTDKKHNDKKTNNETKHKKARDNN